jgi:hypothetical protein
MEVKGTAIESLPLFVKKYYPERYNEWLNSLSEKSRDIMQNALTAEWYPLEQGLTEPTMKVCELFYNGDKKGAWEAGRFSADHSLKGVYKVFVRFGSPHFIIKRASRILPTFYTPSTMKVVGETKRSTTLQIIEFPKLDKIIELRIGGWIERALEICGCKNVKIDIPKSLTIGNPLTEFDIKWS